MAWRPHDYLIEGRLDNTQPGKVTGWLAFNGLLDLVTLSLKGDFHRDIRGAAIRLKGRKLAAPSNPAKYFAGFSPVQEGKVGDITAGLPPRDYTPYPYIEWYSGNGRVVLELDHDQVQVLGTTLPWDTTEPISREQQAQNMAEFLQAVTGELGKAFATSTAE